MEKIYYSVEQARRIIPEVARRFRKILRFKASLELLDSFQIESEEYNLEFDLIILELQKRYHKIMHAMLNEIQKLAVVGAVVKDIDEGLVDFFSFHDDHDILLCWKFGEKTIEYWHDVETGYEGRKPVSLLENKYLRKR